MANDDDLTEVEQHAYAHAEGWEHHYREEHKRVEALEAEGRALQVAKQLAERRVDEGRVEMRTLREALVAVERAAIDPGVYFENRIASIVAITARALAPEPPEGA